MNHIDNTKLTGIAVSALVVAVIAFALAWVAYDRVDGFMEQNAESSLTPMNPASSENSEPASSSGSSNSDSPTVPQSQP